MPESSIVMVRRFCKCSKIVDEFSLGHSMPESSIVMVQWVLSGKAVLAIANGRLEEAILGVSTSFFNEWFI